MIPLNVTVWLVNEEEALFIFKNWSIILKSPNCQSSLLGKISSLTSLNLENKSVTHSLNHGQLEPYLS